MAGGIDWFRWHHGSVTDPKFALVARRAGCSLPDVLAVWAYLLERASAAEMRGEFGDVDRETVDCLFGFEDGTTSAILTHMNGRDLIAGGCIVAWNKRQPKRERDPAPIQEESSHPMTSTERSRKHRAAKQGQQDPEEAMQRHATPCNATGRQETPREEESKEDISKTSSSHPPGGGRADRFDDFWISWPKNERKQDKAKCLAHWKLHSLDAMADVILADVRTKRGTVKWQDGFVEAPLVYLRGRRWEDEVTPDERRPDSARSPAPAGSGAPTQAEANAFLAAQAAIPKPDPDMARQARERFGLGKKHEETAA